MAARRKDHIPFVVSLVVNAVVVLAFACITLYPHTPENSDELMATITPSEEAPKMAQVDPIEEILKQAQQEVSQAGSLAQRADVSAAASQSIPPATLKFTIPTVRSGPIGPGPSTPRKTFQTVEDATPYIRPEPEVLAYQIAARNGDEKLVTAMQHWTTYENGERRLEKGLKTIPKNSPIYAVLSKIKNYLDQAEKEWSNLPQTSEGFGERAGGQGDSALELELSGIAGENQGNGSPYGAGADPLRRQNIVVIYDISNSMRDTGPKEQIAKLQQKNHVRVITCTSGLISTSKGGQNDYGADYQRASDAILAACRENRGKYSLIVVVSDFREKSEVGDKLQEIARFLKAANLRLYLDTTLDFPRENTVDLAKGTGGGIVKSYQVLAE